jgi:hypothetical protein
LPSEPPASCDAEHGDEDNNDATVRSTAARAQLRQQASIGTGVGYALSMSVHADSVSGFVPWWLRSGEPRTAEADPLKFQFHPQRSTGFGSVGSMLLGEPVTESDQVYAQVMARTAAAAATPGTGTRRGDDGGSRGGGGGGGSGGEGVRAAWHVQYLRFQRPLPLPPTPAPPSAPPTPGGYLSA